MMSVMTNEIGIRIRMKIKKDIKNLMTTIWYDVINAEPYKKEYSTILNVKIRKFIKVLLS